VPRCERVLLERVRAGQLRRVLDDRCELRFASRVLQRARVFGNGYVLCEGEPSVLDSRRLLQRALRVGYVRGLCGHGYSGAVGRTVLFGQSHGALDLLRSRDEWGVYEQRGVLRRRHDVPRWNLQVWWLGGLLRDPDPTVLLSPELPGLRLHLVIRDGFARRPIQATVLPLERGGLPLPPPTRSQ
jgi:hypothetical protein